MIRAWRIAFGVLSLVAFVMAWVSIWTPGDLRVAATWGFVYAVSTYLALEPEAQIVVYLGEGE